MEQEDWAAGTLSRVDAAPLSQAPDAHKTR
jgi:hypothetical protein